MKNIYSNPAFLTIMILSSALLLTCNNSGHKEPGNPQALVDSSCACACANETHRYDTHGPDKGAGISISKDSFNNFQEYFDDSFPNLKIRKFYISKKALQNLFCGAKGDTLDGIGIYLGLTGLSKQDSIVAMFQGVKAKFNPKSLPKTNSPCIADVFCPSLCDYYFIPWADSGGKH